jgi:hypothetical protein
MNWLDTARQWPVTAQPDYNNGDIGWIHSNGLIYEYFSPYRPLSFICGQLGSNILIVNATQPGAQFLFTAAPVPRDRVEAWQLIPNSDKAWQAVQETTTNAETNP